MDMVFFNIKICNSLAYFKKKNHRSAHNPQTIFSMVSMLLETSKSRLMTEQNGRDTITLHLLQIIFLLLWNKTSYETHFSRNLFSPSSPTFQPGGLVFPGPSQPLTKTTSTLGPRAIQGHASLSYHAGRLRPKSTRLGDKLSSCDRRLRHRQNSHGFGILDSIWSHVRCACPVVKNDGCSIW